MSTKGKAETTHILYRDMACRKRVGRIRRAEGSKVFTPVIFSRPREDLSSRDVGAVVQNVADYLGIDVCYAPLEDA